MQGEEEELLHVQAVGWWGRSEEATVQKWGLAAMMVPSKGVVVVLRRGRRRQEENGSGGGDGSGGHGHRVKKARRARRLLLDLC